MSLFPVCVMGLYFVLAAVALCVWVWLREHKIRSQADLKWYLARRRLMDRDAAGVRDVVNDYLKAHPVFTEIPVEARVIGVDADSVWLDLSVEMDMIPKTYRATAGWAIAEALGRPVFWTNNFLMVEASPAVVTQLMGGTPAQVEQTG